MNLSKFENTLFGKISNIIETSRHTTISYANSSLTLMFWRIGQQISVDLLHFTRAEYGKQIIVTVSRQLQEKYGRNFEEKNIRRMIQFAEKFSNEDIVVTLSRQLSWSHFIAIIPLKTLDARLFYASEVSERHLSVRELRKNISRKSFERSDIANAQITTNSKVPTDIFKDPYLFDFLNLTDGYLENDLELAILQELEKFILEVGKGFAFVERQKRMIIDGEDFYLDLLFYHRHLKRLIAFELKLGKFHARHKGQMELYLKWLNKYEKQDGENEPIGLILCTESSREQIELLEMHKDGIMVAEYWTELPPKNEFEEKIKTILQDTKERYECRNLALTESSN